MIKTINTRAVIAYNVLVVASQKAHGGHTEELFSHSSLRSSTLVLLMIEMFRFTFYLILFSETLQPIYRNTSSKTAAVHSAILSISLGFVAF